MLRELSFEELIYFRYHKMETEHIMALKVPENPKNIVLTKSNSDR
jgi:hypothetical protein